MQGEAPEVCSGHIFTVSFCGSPHHRWKGNSATLRSLPCSTCHGPEDHLSPAGWFPNRVAVCHVRAVALPSSHTAK